MRYWDFLKKNLKSDMLTLIMIHVTFIRYHLQLKEWKSQLCRSFDNLNNKSKKKFSRSNAVIFLFCSKIAAFHVHEKQIKLANNSFDLLMCYERACGTWHFSSHVAIYRLADLPRIFPFDNESEVGRKNRISLQK